MMTTQAILLNISTAGLVGTSASPGQDTTATKQLPEYFSNFTDMFHDFYENAVKACSNDISGNEMFLVVLSWAAIVALLCILITSFHKFRFNIRETSLKGIFVFTWIYGFLVYDIGMSTGEKMSLITNAPMAVYYAFKIFVLESDVSQIQNDFHENWLFSGNFALVHFLAACVTTLFLIKHFGFNLISSIRMWFAAHGRKFDDVYVLWGLNDASLHLAQDIKKHYTNNKKDYRTIIVRTNQTDDDSPENRTAMNRILDFLSMKNSEHDALQSIGCLSTGTYVDLARIDKISGEQGAPDIFRNTLRLKKLRRILKRKVRKNIHILFLSNDEMENLHDVTLLMEDKTLRDFATKDKADKDKAEGSSNQEHNVIFYCHARHNSVHRVIEDRIPMERMSVKVIDSSHINVEIIKQNKDVLPVNYVEVNDDATVSSEFNALVIGFSEVGLDSVRFLYEFGAFVQKGGDYDHAERSKFHLDVVDNEMADCAGIFVANAPAIKPSMPFIPGKENPEALITLHQMDCRSAEFYLKLESWIKKLNYVVLATDNDELNISMGVRIFKAAARYRDNMDKFCILVRAHDDSDGHIAKIARHYNLLWLAQENIKNYNGTEFEQDVVTAATEVNGPIHIFGLDKETYTYANIIDNALEIKAIEFKERYEMSSNTNYVKSNDPNDNAWQKEIKKVMWHKNKDNNYCYPSYSGIMRLRRTQGQDLANSLHAVTKRLLAEKALEKAGIPDLDWKQLSRKSKATDYTLKNGKKASDKISRLLCVLAQTEHLRWNASHEILGYVRANREAGKKDEVRMEHGSITTWENVKADQHYDFNVVDVTLDIIDPEHPIKK